jgi:hypothetical protein
MKTIEIRATVTEDHKVTLQLPPDVEPGEHEMVVTIMSEAKPNGKPSTFDLPVHNCGMWPENLSLRREDMYDEWGR